MADAYDISSQVSNVGGYGSPGGAAFFGVQQELLRRAQLEEQARLHAEAKRRQDAIDAQNAERIQQEIAASRENTASQTETRTQNAAKAKQEAADKAIGGIMSAVPPIGSEVDPAVVDAVTKIDPIRGGLYFAKPTPAVPATEPLQEGDQGPERPAEPAKGYTNLGTEKQRADEEHKKTAQEIVNGDHDTGNEALDQWMKARAQEELMGKATGTIPASLVVPKTATETDQRKALDIGTRLDTDKPVSPEETAWLKRFLSLHPTEAQKQQNVLIRLEKSGEMAATRQDKTLLGQVKSTFRKDITAENAKLAEDLARTDRAELVLNSKNFLADAVAAPEVLQIMAGGMGSGLRMTDAELNRVNSAQPKLDQLRGELAKWGLGAPVTLQDEIRKNMKILITTVKQARDRKAKLQEDTLRQLDEATSPGDVDTLHADYWGKRRATEDMTGQGGAATDAAPAGVTVRRISKPKG